MPVLRRAFPNLLRQNIYLFIWVLSRAINLLIGKYEYHGIGRASRSGSEFVATSNEH
jgi:hypothetical protein